MPMDPKLERYLSTLDRALRPLPVSERADILVEIKSHVLAALERDPKQAMDRVLSALGEPETVANRYLMERGQAPVKPPISPIVKWLVIGFLGTVAMVLLFVGVIILKFAPGMHLDLDSLSIGTSTGSGRHSQGSYPWKSGEKRPLAIRAGNAKLEFRTSSSGKFSWDCKGLRGGALEIKETEKDLTLDLTVSPSVKCELELPENARASLELVNGKVSIHEPRFHLNGKVTNGKIDFLPDSGKKYHYDFSVVNGRTDSFESSSDPAAFQIALHLINGTISRND